MGSLKKLKGRGAAALFTLLVFGLPATAWANAGEGGPDVVGAVAGLTAFTAVALIFHMICSRIGLPAILGWILSGVLVGNLPFEGAHHMIESEFLTLMGEVGICFLMFKSGLEAKPQAIKQNLVGAGAVALLGVLFVGALGYAVAKMLLPADSNWLAYVYVAASLTPTSAGIPAAIFAAKNKASSNEGITVLVAAVLDDVLGLVVMALLGALATTVQSGGPIEAGPLMISAAKGLGFVGVGFYLGVWVLPRYMGGALKLKAEFLLPAAIVVALGFAYLGTLFGLAPLIGAYVAGLVFEQIRYKDEAPEHGAHPVELEHLVAPIVDIMAPIFFVLIGTKVPLAAFTNPTVLLLAVALTAATLGGKILSGIGVMGGARRAPVIAGMMPRGEVASIMVKMGAALGLVSPEVFTSFVLMIAFTTVLAILGLNKFLEPKPAPLRHGNVDGGR